MGFMLSPGVNVSEIDLTTVIPSVQTTNGAFVGRFKWGPIGKRELIDSEIKLANKFGEPDSNTYQYFFTAANFLAYGNNLRVVRAANTASKNATNNGAGQYIPNEDVYQANYLEGEGNFGGFCARYAGDWGNNLRVSTCPSATAWYSNLTSQTVGLTANATPSGNTIVSFTPGTNLITDYLAVGDLVYVGSNTGSSITLKDSVSGKYQTWIQVTQIDNANGFIRVSPGLTANVGAGARIHRRWYYYDQFDSAPKTSEYANTVSGLYDEIHVIVTDNTKVITGKRGTVLEKYPFLSKARDAKDETGSSLYYPFVLFDKSKWVYWGDHQTGALNWGTDAASTTFTYLNKPYYSNFGGGVEATLTNGDLEDGYDLFSNPDVVDVSLIVAPPLTTATYPVAQYIIDNITDVRKDCVAFISPRFSDVVNQAGNEVDNTVDFRLNVLDRSSSYVVMDSAWKFQYDKYNDKYRWIPCCGDTAGLCVRTDTTRDPWFSPAGFNRGQIKNLIRLSWTPGQAERDELYRNGINPYTTFPGEGTILYGDKTLQTKPSAFGLINVRRLFIVLEKAIARAAKYSLFEFNDEFTRAQFVSMVTPYLRDIQGRRGIYDFRVVCDTTINTPEVIDRNEFRGDIYIKPARSVNFIQLNFVAVRTGVSFEEVTGKF